MTDLDTDFEALYRAEVHGLTRVGTALTGSPETAAELVHEAFVRALRNWPKVRRLDRPGAWVRRVLINLAIDTGRRRQRERRAVERLGRDDAAASSPGEPVVERYWDEVRRLPERQQLAVVLRYVDDRSVAEIAEVMGVTEGTVKTSLFTARRTLAAAFAVEEGSDDLR